MTTEGEETTPIGVGNPPARDSHSNGQSSTSSNFFTLGTFKAPAKKRKRTERNDDETLPRVIPRKKPIASTGHPLFKVDVSVFVLFVSFTTTLSATFVFFTRGCL